MLGCHYWEIENANNLDKKKRQKVMNNVIKNQQQLHTLHFLARHAGKGIKGHFKKLIVSDKNRAGKTIIERKATE